MAKNTPASKKRRPRRSPAARSSRAKRTWQIAIPFDRKNLMIFGVALATIVVGFALMATGMTEEVDHGGIWNSPIAIAVAPVLLVIGYCVIVPLAIMYRPKRVQAETAE